MKISVDGVELLTFTETQKKVFQYDMRADTYERVLKGMIIHVLEHKFKRCYDRLKKEWEPKIIKAGAKEVPLDKEKFAEHVFKHKDYKNRSAKEAIKKEKEKTIEVKPEAEVGV